MSQSGSGLVPVFIKDNISDIHGGANKMIQLTKTNITKCLNIKPSQWEVSVIWGNATQ